MPAIDQAKGRKEEKLDNTDVYRDLDKSLHYQEGKEIADVISKLVSAP